MTKGERTKQRIVEQAATLFNVRGYANTAVVDVSDAAGLEKGAVYNYFPAKDALALAAFDYNAKVIRDALTAAAASETGPAEQLRAMLKPYGRTGRRALVAGGCPLMNTAIEATDNHAPLRDRARKAFTAWFSSVEAIVARGVREGAFRADLEPKAVASAFVAAIEGGVLLSRLFRDQAHMDAVIAHLTVFVDSLAA